MRRQSEHLTEHARALRSLADQGLLYACTCTRAEIRAEIARSGGAPHGPEGPPYPGTCRGRWTETRRREAAPGDHALRLDVGEALRRTGPLDFVDERHGVVEARPGLLGDVVLARKETPTSYHLAVTVDDAVQGVTLVTRGDDLLPATHVHRVLQALLGLPVPRWHHHPMLTGPDGRRLSKRDGAATLRSLREGGASPRDVRRLAGLDEPAGGD